MHDVIRKLQGNPDPVAAVQELLQGASMLADAAGVEIRYEVIGTTTTKPDTWHAGMGHIHAAIAMLNVRVTSPLGEAIKRTKALPTTR